MGRVKARSPYLGATLQYAGLKGILVKGFHAINALTDTSVALKRRVSRSEKPTALLASLPPPPPQRSETVLIHH